MYSLDSFSTKEFSPPLFTPSFTPKASHLKKGPVVVHVLQQVQLAALARLQERVADAQPHLMT
jgi:hypothetical protein